MNDNIELQLKILQTMANSLDRIKTIKSLEISSKSKRIFFKSIVKQIDISGTQTFCLMWFA